MRYPLTSLICELSIQPNFQNREYKALSDTLMYIEQLVGDSLIPWKTILLCMNHFTSFHFTSFHFTSFHFT